MNFNVRNTFFVRCFQNLRGKLQRRKNRHYVCLTCRLPADRNGSKGASKVTLGDVLNRATAGDL